MTTIASHDVTETAEETPRPSRWRRALQVAVRVIAGTLLAAFLALAIAVGIAPRILGEETLTIMSQSMARTYNPGDVVIVKSQQDVHAYQIGDVITFQPNSGDPTTFTHRIIGVSMGGGRDSVDGVAGFTTQGDANNVPDKPIVPAQVQSKVLYSVPLVGYGIEWIKQVAPMSPAGEATLLQAFGGALVLGPLAYLIPWRRLVRRGAPQE